MMIRLLLLVAALATAAPSLHSQQYPSAIATPPAAAATPGARTLFRPRPPAAAPATLSRELTDFGLLETDDEAYATLYAAAPDRWTLELPATPAGPAATLVLERNHFLGPDFSLRSAATGRSIPAADLGHHYRGHVAGHPGSVVALSLLEGELTATITRGGTDRLALGLVTPDKGTAKTPGRSTYAIFPHRELLGRHELGCATADDGAGYTREDLAPASGPKSSRGGCVDVYLEVDYDIYAARGYDATAAAAFVAANFNEVSILYRAIDVNLSISEMQVWEEISPYAGAQSGTLLSQFRNHRRTFNGDVAQLLSFQSSGGIAVLDGLCHPDSGARMSFSSINARFESVPVYSWSVMVIAHELGHLLGSRHTHACAWNGNNTALDNCPGFTEGTCASGTAPATGGSIMSYCHINRVGIDFRYGFGPQPGAVIANRVAAARGCVQASCGGGGGGNPPGGGGGGDDDPGPPVVQCDEQPVYLRLVLDDFGPETSWLLRAEGGDTLATGGPYPKKQAGRIVRDTVCVPDGCYHFVISDRDGDGLCCDYGAGSYRLTDSLGTVLGAGNSFDTTEVTDFCLPYLPPPTGEDCLSLDFNRNRPRSFGRDQDQGQSALLDNGTVLRLSDNAWKAVPLEYDITEQTVLTFWFRSTRRGEIHGIGLDDNDIISSSFTFRLYGTQDWGIDDYATYAGDGQWQFFRIPVGQHYRGRSSFLFFAADRDGGQGRANSFFRDVTLAEGGDCGGGDGAELRAPEAHDGPVLYPNPAGDFLRVTGARADAYRLLTLDGREVGGGGAAGAEFTVNTAPLPTGTYLLQLVSGAATEVRRFSVMH